MKAREGQLTPSAPGVFGWVAGGAGAIHRIRLRPLA